MGRQVELAGASIDAPPGKFSASCLASPPAARVGRYLQAVLHEISADFVHALNCAVQPSVQVLYAAAFPWGSHFIPQARDCSMHCRCSSRDSQRTTSQRGSRESIGFKTVMPHETPLN